MASRFRVVVLLGAVLSGSLAGCATFDDVRYEHTQKKRTCAAWRCYDSQSSCHFGCDYEDGWKAGYYDVLTGGCGEPPVVAPRKYWNPHTILKNCDQRRNRWYVGFQDGAAAAKNCPDTHYLKLWMPPSTCRTPIGCPVGPGPQPGADGEITPIAPAVDLGTPLPLPEMEGDDPDADEDDRKEATDIPAPPAEEEATDEDDDEYAPGLNLPQPQDEDTGDDAADMADAADATDTDENDETDADEPATEQESFAERLRRMSQPKGGADESAPRLPGDEANEFQPERNPVMPPQSLRPGRGVSRTVPEGREDFTRPTPRDLPRHLDPRTTQAEPTPQPVRPTVEALPIKQAVVQPPTVFELPTQPIATAAKRANPTTTTGSDIDAATEAAATQAAATEAAASDFAAAMKSVVGEAAGRPGDETGTVTLDQLGNAAAMFDPAGTVEAFDLNAAPLDDQPVDMTPAELTIDLNTPPATPEAAPEPAPQANPVFILGGMEQGGGKAAAPVVKPTAEPVAEAKPVFQLGRPIDGGGKAATDSVIRPVSY